eukprot:COSAG02_NODE_1604_length_11728_cov_42.819417_2_plen_256_part_00
MHLYLHLRSAEFDIRVALAYHDCVCTVVVNGFRESLWSSMRWLHNLRCQGCSEAKHRAIFDRANVRQRSELYWGGWAEEIPDPKPQTVGEDQPRDRLEPKKYRLRWLRLCKTCAHMRTEMVAEWKRCNCGSSLARRPVCVLGAPKSLLPRPVDTRSLWQGHFQGDMQQRAHWLSRATSEIRAKDLAGASCQEPQRKEFGLVNRCRSDIGHCILVPGSRTSSHPRIKRSFPPAHLQRDDDAIMYRPNGELVPIRAT